MGLLSPEGKIDGGCIRPMLVVLVDVLERLG